MGQKILHSSVVGDDIRCDDSGSLNIGGNFPAIGCFTPLGNHGGPIVVLIMLEIAVMKLVVLMSNAMMVAVLKIIVMK